MTKNLFSKDTTELSLKEIASGGSLLLSEKETAELLCCGRSTLARHRSQGIGIPYFKIGRSCRYSIDDVLKFIKSKRIETEDSRSSV